MAENKDKVFSNTVINWYPGHMVKTKKDLMKNKDLVDIVYEVIDARCPISSRLEEMDTIIGNKPRIVIATKYDLCDKSVTDKLIGKDVFKINLLNDSIKPIINKTLDIMKTINEKRISKGLKPRKARVMIVGVPNVGKSSLINRLVSKKVVGVGNKAGVTKHINWIRVGKDIELLDSPGVLWPKFEDQERALILCACQCIKEEVVDRGLVCEFIIKKLYELYPSKLEERYGISDISDMIEVYETIGKKRGCLVKGGVVDYDKVIDVVIRDFNNGYFREVSLDR